MIAQAERGRTRVRPAQELRDAVRASAENRPGVYRMVGPDGRVLYVGKSIRVRSRLLSYFREPVGTKAEELLRFTDRIEWEYVPSEFGALLLEMKSIKECRPPFNVVHKRDRVFAFVRVTREPAPRLQAVGRVLPDGSRYFGPFAGPDRIRTAVREIADVLELRDCARNTPVRFADQLELFRVSRGAPLCLRGDLGRCLAPCVGGCTRSEYDARARLTLAFLRGEADDPIEMLRRRMADAVSHMRFEHAAVLRDRIERLEQLREELIAARDSIESLTFFYPVKGAAGDDRVYVIRRGLVLAEAPWPRTPQAHAALLESGRRLMREGTRGLQGVGATEASEILIIARWFRRRPAELESVWRPDDPDPGIDLPV